MKMHIFITLSFLSIICCFAEAAPEEWTTKAKQELIKDNSIPIKIIELKPGEKTEIIIRASVACVIGYRMNPSFILNKAKYFVMMRGEGFGESGAAVGLSGMMKPKEGLIIVEFHNRGKTTEQFIVYRKRVAKGANTEEKKSAYRSSLINALSAASKNLNEGSKQKPGFGALSRQYVTTLKPC